MKHSYSNTAFFSLVAQELDEAGKVRFRVKGVSMQPLLRNGRDEVLVEKVCGEKTGEAVCLSSLKKGDIILFRFQGNCILHRISRIQDGIYHMKGDNTYGGREQCRAGDILGKVTRIYRQKTLSPVSDSSDVEQDSWDWQEENPYSCKWNSIASIWRVRCSIYRVLSAVWHHLEK